MNSAEVETMVRLISTGMLTWIAGATLNFSALLANGWLFPEWAPGSYAGYINAEAARLAWLGDWINIGYLWFSPGDFLIFGGLAVMLMGWSGLLLYGIRTGRWQKPVPGLEARRAQEA